MDSIGKDPFAFPSIEAAYVRESMTSCQKAGVPTHAARQMPSGRWTSKLGFREDIEHDLHAVSGDLYGTVVLLLKRPRGNHGA